MDFYRDAQNAPDCLDQTDENEIIDHFFDCIRDPTYPCEERTCRPNSLSFPCDDGRIDLLANKRCAYAIVCLTKEIEYFDDDLNDWYNRFCWPVESVEDYCMILI